MNAQDWNRLIGKARKKLDAERRKQSDKVGKLINLLYLYRRGDVSQVLYEKIENAVTERQA